MKSINNIIMIECGGNGIVFSYNNKYCILIHRMETIDTLSDTYSLHLAKADYISIHGIQYMKPILCQWGDEL